MVISPLIALMRDQVDALVRRKVNAASLDSTLTADKSAWVKQEVIEGRMKMLYVAPERSGLFLIDGSTFADLCQAKQRVLHSDVSACVAS